jgi:hypothetical protein
MDLGDNQFEIERKSPRGNDSKKKQLAEELMRKMSLGAEGIQEEHKLFTEQQRRCTSDWSRSLRTKRTSKSPSGEWGRDLELTSECQRNPRSF